jgi:uncharacterized protein YlxP (DUF503 family)
MTVVTLRLDLRLLRCPSPRDARRQVGAILEKLHRHFNVSVAVAEGTDGFDQAVLLVAVAAKTRKEARETLARVADALAAHPRAEVTGHEITEV